MYVQDGSLLATIDWKSNPFDRELPERKWHMKILCVIDWLQTDICDGVTSEMHKYLFFPIGQLLRRT